MTCCISMPTPLCPTSLSPRLALPRKTELPSIVCRTEERPDSNKISDGVLSVREPLFSNSIFSCLRAGCREGGCAVLPCSSRLCRAAQTPLPSDGVRTTRFCTSQVRMVAPTHPHVILFPTPEHALCLNGMWRTKERGGSGSTPQSPRQSFPTAAHHAG